MLASSSPGEVNGTCFKFESQQDLSVILLRREVFTEELVLIICEKQK